MDKSKYSALLYDKIARKYADKFKEPTDHIDDFLNLVKKNGRILDVGCGVGVDANHMASKGFGLIGIDMSKEMINIAKQNFPDIDFRVMDMRKLPFEPNSFDGIFVAYSLIHVPKKETPQILEKLNTILRPHGIIYIAIQEGDSKEIFITEPLKPDEKMFINVFSSDEIKELVKKAGFSIVREYRRRAKSKEELDFIKLFVIAVKD